MRRRTLCLKNVWETLSRGEIEGIGTGVGRHLRKWRSRSLAIGWMEIQTKDYAGSLVQLTDTGVPELRAEVREWLVGSDAIFILVNADLCDGDPTGGTAFRKSKCCLIGYS